MGEDTSSITKTTTISKLENYIDDNYDEAAKIELRQTILRELKELPNETKEKGHLDELLRSLHYQISSPKSEIGFLREDVKEKNNVIRTLSLAKQNNRVKVIQIDGVIQTDPDETTHLTNTEATSSNINEMSHKENQPIRKNH